MNTILTLLKTSIFHQFKAQNFFIALILVLTTSLTLNAQETIPVELYGTYIAPLGDEDSGDELHFVFEQNKVFKKAFNGDIQFTTFYKVISFEKSSGKVVLQSLYSELVEEGELTRQETEESIEIHFITASNKYLIRSDIHTFDFIKHEN